MKVLLIHPPYWTGERKPLGYVSHSTIPLGLCYIGAMLEANGFETSILDMHKLEMTMEDLEKRITKTKPDVVGITSMTCNFPNAVKVAKAVKLGNPDTVVVVGGVHATFMHREIVRDVPEIDFVVRYEGEFTMSELVYAIDRGLDLSNIKGITFRRDGNTVSTSLRERIDDLDSLPYPAFHLLEPPVEEYIGSGEERGVPVITTRGCPFECIFCSTAAFHGHKYRIRETAKVVDELEYLKDKYKANNISFVDDNFTMQKERVYELCRQMKERNLSMKWGCSTRVDLLTEDLLKTMKEAGCDDIFFGIESASQEVLDIIKKRFTVQQAKDMVIAAEKIGIRTHCSFIIGLPGESAESLNSMIKFFDETKPSGRALPNILEILPGTELYEKREEYFSGKPPIPFADITTTQLDMLLKFYKINFGIEELFRVTPPNIVIE
ncbi:MAG: cobalamin B12-binding domain-containing protein [archaeon]|nr:cobalamin B12-binding domain-containing protein [archaeon]